MQEEQRPAEEQGPAVPESRDDPRRPERVPPPPKPEQARGEEDGQDDIDRKAGPSAENQSR